MKTLPFDIEIVKSCYRCGGEFSSAGRVCPACRAPRVLTRRLQPATRDLSFRERQIAQLVCQGKQNKEIAFELHLTEGTIKEYLNRIFRKLDIKNRTGLAVWAIHNLQVAA